MEGNNLTAQSRDYNIDLLKILACIAVVGAHTFNKDLSIWNTILYYLCGFGLPIFFMSNGAFLMNRKDTSLQYSARKIYQILTLVFSWGIIIVLARFAVSLLFHGSKLTVKIILQDLVGGVIQKGTMWHFWYLGAMVILYILLPVLTRTNIKQKYVLLAGTGIFAIALQVISYLNGYPIQKYVCQTFRLWSWLFYFILGGMLYDKYKDKFLSWSISKRVAIITMITLIVMIYQNFMGRFVLSDGSGVLHFEYFYDSISMMIWVLVIFLLVSTIHLSSKAIIIIARISPLTTGIYILHPLIIRIYQHFIPTDTLWLSLLYFIMILLGSAVIVAILRRIPILKNLIEI